MPVPRGPQPPHALILAARARAFRRELGAVAWAVLEDVATDAVSGVAATNARRVAADLGMGKDAAAHALSRLVDAGVLVRVGQVRGAGRFGVGAYELRLPPGLLVPCPVGADTGGDQADRRAVGHSDGGRRRGRRGPQGDSSPRSASPSPDRPARRGRQAAAADSDQLSLLDAFDGDAVAETRTREPRNEGRGTEGEADEGRGSRGARGPRNPRDEAAGEPTPGGITPLHRGCGEWAGDVADDVTGRSSPDRTRPC